LSLCGAGSWFKEKALPLWQGFLDLYLDFYSNCKNRVLLFCCKD